MEISKAQIARLVLGYLKSENCESAFHEFLLKSQYLKSLAVFVKNGKYFATRVGGLTLEDILAEYSEVSLTIQGMLEQTDYYEKEYKREKAKLSTQLLFILDHNSRSPSPTLPKTLNATPSESLPGNSSNTSIKSSVLSEECTTHPGFDNISNISSSSQKSDKKTAMAELDKQLKTIEEKKEQDPAFDEILEEIIGHKNVSSTDGSTSRNYKNQSSSINVETANTDNFLNNVKPENSQPSVSTMNSEIVVMDPFVNKSVTSSSQQSQFILTNTPAGLLMVPSVMAGQNYIFVNSGPPASSTPTGNVLTENDIMKMPTVILDDGSSARASLMAAPQSQLTSQYTQRPADQPPVMTQSQIILSNSTCHTVTSQSQTGTKTHSAKRVKTIAPKTDKITIATSDGGYYKVFDEKGSQDSDQKVSESESCQKSPKNRPSLRRRLSRQSKNKNIMDEEPPVCSSPEKSPSESTVVEASKKETRKSAKSLFKDIKGGKKDTKKDVWDSDLRELLIPNSVSKKPNNRLDTSEDRIDTSDDRFDTTDNQLDVTCDDEELKKGALMIEAAFKTPVKTPATQKHEDVQVEEENAPPAEVGEGTSEDKSETAEKPEELVEEIEEVVETEVYLRNCNGPPRFKKKCNQTTSSADIFEVEVIEDSPMDVQKTEPVELNDQPGPSNVRKNIVLETPVKGGVPKTPGKFEMTPFTKVLEEQLQGMDLLSLSTPKMTITPNFPITPNVDLTTPDHHSSRPTDYSTSSSYYQPSDTEQNKSLEAMMEEYRREERAKVMTKSEENVMSEKEMTVMAQMTRMFNENVIGKKNLSMMKQENPPCMGDTSNSSNSSSSSSSESSSDSDSDSDFDNSISKKSISVPKEPYSFRKRKSPVPNSPNDVKNTTLTPTPKSNKKIISVQQEIKEKKERTIKAIKKNNKNTSTPGQTRIILRNKDGKFAKHKKPKISPQTDKEIVEKCDVENEITDDDFALHLSTDEDSINKIHNDTVISRSKEEKPANNVEEPATEEAKQLIQGLSERGIYLVPKVSPKTSDPCLSSKKTPSEDENKLENLEVSSEENSVREESRDDSFRNPVDVVFDIRNSGAEQSFNFVYDSSKRRKKKVYDVEVLKRSIQADVYIESLDIDIVRIIKCSPIENVLEYIPKKPPPKRRKSVKPESKPVKDTKQIQETNTTSVKPESKPVKDTKRIQETNTKTEIEKKIVDANTENKEKCAEKRKKDIELKKSPQKKLKTADTKAPIITETKDQKNSKTSETTSQKISETKSQKKPETLQTKSENKSEITDAKSPKKPHSKRLKSVDSVSKTSHEGNEKEKTDETVPLKSDNLERTVIEKCENADGETLRDVGPGYDDLMNFAILGNLVDAEKETSCKSRNKRQLSSEGENIQPEKKCKIENEKNQALLKKIDVDSFLNKVHGDERPT